MCNQTEPYPNVALSALFAHALIDRNTGASLDYHQLMVGPENNIGSVARRIKLADYPKERYHTFHLSQILCLLLIIWKLPKVKLPLTFQ